MIAQQLAVIGRHDDQRVVVEPPLLQLVDQAADLVVDLLHHAVIGRTELCDVAGAEIGDQPLPGDEVTRLLLRAQIAGQKGMLLGLRVHRRRATRRRHVGRIVERVVGLGGDERRVWANVGRVREPGAVATHRDVVEQAIRQEGGDAVLRLEACRRKGRSAVAGRTGRPVDLRDVVGEGIALGLEIGHPRVRQFRQMQFRREAGHDGFVGPQRRVVGRQPGRVGRRVGIAEQRRIVAGLAAFQGDVGEATRERRAVPHDTVVVLVGTGQQRRARRPAGSRLHEMAAAEHTIGGQAVEIRGLQDGIARTAKCIGPPLVDDDEEDIPPRDHQLPPFPSADHRAHGLIGQFNITSVT